MPNIETKRSKRIKTLVALVALIVSQLLTGCAVSIGKEWCEVSAENVHHSKGTPSDMVAKSRATCTAPVQVSGYVEIQKKGFFGNWETYTREDFKSFTVTPGKKVTRQAAVTCAQGTYRNKTHVVATYGGETKTGTAHSTPVTDPCK